MFAFCKRNAFNVSFAAMTTIRRRGSHSIQSRHSTSANNKRWKMWKSRRGAAFCPRGNVAIPRMHKRQVVIGQDLVSTTRPMCTTVFWIHGQSHRWMIQSLFCRHALVAKFTILGIRATKCETAIPTFRWTHAWQRTVAP